MKNTLLAAMTLTAAIAINPAPAFAHEDHEHEAPAPKVEEKPAKPADDHGHSHSTRIPAALEDIWKEIRKQHAELVRTVDEKRLGAAHDPAFAIRDLVKALPGKVPAENQAKAEEGAREIAKLAADIARSGAAGAQKTTEENVKKMGAAIESLGLIVPRSDS